METDHMIINNVEELLEGISPEGEYKTVLLLPPKTINILEDD